MVQPLAQATRRSIACAASRAGWPASSSGSMTFSSAVRLGSSWKDWNTKPTWLARRRARPSSSRAKRSWPARCTLPDEGTSRPASSPSKVDLPEPELPVMATALPARTVKSMPSRIDSSPPASATRLPSPFTSIELPLSMRIVFRLLAPCLAAIALAATLPAQAQTASAPTGSAPHAVLVVGDSLSAEYGLRRGSGWVPMLAQRVSQQSPTTASSMPASAAIRPAAGWRACRRCCASTRRPSSCWNWGPTMPCAAWRWT